MHGIVTSWDVLLHPLLIVRGFGPRCYLRCLHALISRRGTTFLEVAFRSPDYHGRA
jgi:hypothetical protein